MEGVRLVKQRVPQELPPGRETGVSSKVSHGRKTRDSTELPPDSKVGDS